MPSAKERMKKYRERMKNDPAKHVEHLQKEKDRDRKRRESMKINTNSKLISNEKSRDRMRAYRARLKAAKNLDSLAATSTIGSYKCLQSFGKAVRKLKKNLPDSPLKRVAVVKKIAVEVLGNIVQISTPNQHRKRLDEEIKKAVIEFYFRDDVCRQAPGIKDFKSVKDPVTGKKTKKQKKTMIMTIREAYELFKDDHPDIKIGKSVFYSLRPTEVVPVAFTEHVVCVCALHSNFINTVESIGKCLLEFPKSHTELINATTCSSDNERCMSGSCTDCPYNFWEQFEEHPNLNKTISWKEWTFLNKRPKVVIRTMLCKDAINELKCKMRKFKQHYFLKRVQSNFFQESITGLKENEAVVQVDFAENYKLLSQDETQSAHWSHDQVSIFTCCIWLSNGQKKPVVIVSNDTLHTKQAVWTLMKTVFDYLREVNDTVNTVKIFSDNCAALFKNRYIMSLLWEMKSYAELDDLQWIFFAASHGKGAVDGLGGTVKRVAWTGVKSRKVLLNSAEDFFLYVEKEIKGLHITYVSKIDIEDETAFLDSVWLHILPIQKIQSYHHFRTVNESEIAVAQTSKSERTVVKIKNLNKTIDETHEELDVINHNENDSDWSDEDLLPLAALATNKENETELIVRGLQSTSTVETVKKKLRFSDVYTNSEEEESQEPNAVSVNKIQPGVFVLVKIIAEGKQRTEYKYAAICQSSIDDDEGEVRVMFLKKIDKNAKVFISNEQDVSDIPFENIIEHVWDLLKRKVKSRIPAPANVGELRIAVVEEWRRLSQETIDNIILSMPRRVETLIRARGGNTRY